MRFGFQLVGFGDLRPQHAVAIGRDGDLPRPPLSATVYSWLQSQRSAGGGAWLQGLVVAGAARAACPVVVAAGA
jgi:hypothetical protein